MAFSGGWGVFAPRKVAKAEYVLLGIVTIQVLSRQVVRVYVGIGICCLVLY